MLKRLQNLPRDSRDTLFLLAVIAWVVMPNHVHVLLKPMASLPISKLLAPVKGASARRINLRLGQGGTLWMDESFDHIVRGMDSLRKFQRYIKENPTKAGLKPDEFSYEQRWLLK